MSEEVDDFEGAPEAPEEHIKEEPLTVIMLTPSQRERVKEETGRDMESVDVEDGSGFFASTMSNRHPDEIEMLAIREAQRLNEEEAALREWLLALAAWQDEGEVEQDEKLDDIEDEAEQTCKELEAAFMEEYGAEAMAMEEAKVLAVETWDPKGKKRAKMEKEGIEF